MKELVLHCGDEETTFELGLRVGERVEPRDVLALWGELGAGKTFLARAMARGLGVPERVPVTSPTFTFINEYDGRLHLYHLDLYRLAHPDELETLPWREVLYGSGVAVIEWPERLGEYLPEERFDFRINITGDESRAITIMAQGAAQQARLEKWAGTLQTPPILKI